MGRVAMVGGPQKVRHAGIFLGRRFYSMTLKVNKAFKCPKCGHEESVEVWDTLNVSVSPGDKELLFEGKINLFACSECGHHAFINKPLLYHDMERRFVVQYYPPESLDDPRFYAAFGSGGEPTGYELETVPPSGKYIFSPHIVFDIKEFVRYVWFRDRLPSSRSSPETG
ncbi:MAG: CpXC domain-containing protein [Planctomycetes bacterium]|nr:CpXC domain-containing protein [Planctomycetota bacterium]